MKHAILAAEDERFYQHGGVDYLSVLRAALANVTSGTQQGAGTITMQVARNFFLTREKTVTRKLREVLLAWKIEASLSKDEILELYVNQIFLGQRAYGFAAASQIYFGKPLSGRHASPRPPCWRACPRRPRPTTRSATRARAKTRQLYVLRRMHELRYHQTTTSSAKHKMRHRRASADARDRCRCTPNSSPRWRGRWSSTRTATTRIRAASPSGRRSAAPTRTRRTPPSARGSIDYDQRPRLSRPRGVRQPARPTRPSRITVLDRVFQETPGQRQHADRGRAAGDARRRYAPCLRTAIRQK